MRFGCCLNMVSSEADKGTGINLIEKLADIGYDYVELPLAEMAALTEEEFDLLEKRVKESGLRCEVCNNFFPKTIRLTGDSVNYTEILEYVEHALGRAERLGVEIVVFGSGPAKNVPDGFPLEEGYRQVVELLKMAVPIAKRHKIMIVIEPLRSAECNLINTFKEGCELAEKVTEDNVKVLVDYYHLSVEQEPTEHIVETGKAYLRHVHFANPSGRVYPKTEEESEYGRFFASLKKAEYDSRVSCEAYSDDFGADAKVTLKLLKEMAV